MEEKPSLTFILDTSSSMLERAYSDSFDAEQEYYGYFDPRALYSYNSESDTPYFFADNATGKWSGKFLNWAAMLRIDVARKVLSGGKFEDGSGCYASEPLDHKAAKLIFNATKLDGGVTPLRVKREGTGESGLLQAMENKARVALFTFEDGGHP